MPWGLAEWFIISQTALPALLFAPGTQPIRLLLRIGPFALSLALLAWVVIRPQRRVRPHPSRAWLLVTAAYLVLMILHPTTNTLLAGVAQAMLYLSVLAPALWAPSLVKGTKHLERLLWILLVCNGVNSVVGILQAYDPGTWLPSELSTVVQQSQHVNEFWYEGPDGRSILRPPGLFDTPGAVAGPGAIATVLGLSSSTAGARNSLATVIGVSLAVGGMVAILLSQVRTSGLIAGGMILTYAAARFFGGKRASGMLSLGFALPLVLVSLSLAVAIGGDVVQERFATVFQDAPTTVYYTSLRGPQLEDAVSTLIWEYPLGAGLGRWGMMHYYFGDPDSRTAPSIWAELQPNAWIIDGGIPLLLLYSGALLVSTRQQLRLVMTGRGSLASLAATILAANAGTLALIFGFTPFTNQVGLQYWFLAGALHGAAQPATGVIRRALHAPTPSRLPGLTPPPRVGAAG